MVLGGRSSQFIVSWRPKSKRLEGPTASVRLFATSNSSFGSLRSDQIGANKLGVVVVLDQDDDDAAALIGS